MATNKSDPITEDWLRANGFRWTPEDRGGIKHWLLWLGNAVGDDLGLRSHDDLGLEICNQTFDDKRWHCWVRADYAGRYCRFVHVRYLQTVDEVTALITALTGQIFDPAHVYYGSLRTPENAAKLKQRDEEEMHRRMAREWGQRVERETGADPHKRELLKP